MVRIFFFSKAWKKMQQMPQELVPLTPCCPLVSVWRIPLGFQSR